MEKNVFRVHVGLTLNSFPMSPLVFRYLLASRLQKLDALDVEVDETLLNRC